MDKPDYKKRDDQRGKNPSDYWPLVALILVSAGAALALGWHHGLSWISWMHYFMGIFLSIFALLKLFNPSGFADGFEMYDLIAKRSRIYAYFYPLIELLLGFAYLSFWQPAITYSATIVVMAIGTVGVLSALRRGLDINCPCMGSVLNVPLSTVTLTEDIGMGLMAVAMLMMNVF